MYVQFIQELLIIIYLDILIVHNILAQKKMLLVVYNVVPAVNLDKFSFIVY